MSTVVLLSLVIPLRAILLLFFFGGSVLCAADAITAGTIIIVAQARDYILFAADSRIGTSNGTAVSSVDDTYCKIAPLHGNTLFAAAGIVTGPARTWAADTEMDQILIETLSGQPVSGAAAQSALRVWGDSMARRLLALPRNQLISYIQSNDGVAAAGVLAGIDRDGSAWVHVSRIGLNDVRELSHQESDMTSRNASTKYFGLGQSEIAIEFDHATTPRAIAERARWKSMDLSGREFDRFKARRLVELSIQYLPNKSDVGGPVDEAELDLHGQRWLQVKSNCDQPLK